MNGQFDGKTNLKEVIETEGRFVGTSVGVSMLPMIRSGKDVIVVEKKEGRLKEYDVALYTRGDSYVLHRVLKVIDGAYVIRGDNCYSDEYIPEENVFGVLTEFFRGDKKVDLKSKKYLRYVRRRIKTYPIRKFLMRVKSAVRRFAKRIIKGK